MSGNRRSRNTSRPKHIEVHANDVLNGRGVKIAQHEGNLRFRSLVKQMYDKDYCESFSSSEKKALAWKIIDHIKKKLKPPGRFLKKDGQDGPWIELTKAETEKKTKQALRDCSRPDREGYAKLVKPPQDVDKVDRDRKRSGLSLQEYARNQVTENIKRRKANYNNNPNNPKPPPTFGASSTTIAVPRNSYGASSRTSARALRRFNETFPTTVVNVANNQARNSQTAAPLEPPYQQQAMEAASAVSSTTWTAPSTGSATPAVRPNGPTPVTQTPNPPNYSYPPASDHDHHPINHGSQPNINGHQVDSYHDHYPPRGDFADHHPAVAESVDSVARFPSPIVRSPIVTSAARNNGDVFEDQHEPFLDEWNTGHHRQNLFPPEDPLDSLAASASDSLANHGTGVDDFMLGFPNTNDVADVPGSGDLGI